MSRLHKIVTIFDDVDGVRVVQREYKTVSEPGQSPVDVEIDANERAALYGASHDASLAKLTEARNDAAAAVAARDAAQAQLAEAQAQIAALSQELEALRA